MFFKMLKNDLKAHKGLNIILFIFIVCSSVISVIAANLMYTLVIEKKNTDIPERAEELQKGLDSVDALKTSLKEEKWKLSREKTELHGKVTDAEEKIRKINEAKEPEGGYARLPGERQG